MRRLTPSLSAHGGETLCTTVTRREQLNHMGMQVVLLERHRWTDQRQVVGDSAAR